MLTLLDHVESPTVLTERAECPQCDGTINQADISITTGKAGLGKTKTQHVELHCWHCRIMVSFDRTFTGNVWQRVATHKITPHAELSAAAQRRRLDLDHAIRVEQVMSEPGRDYME